MTIMRAEVQKPWPERRDEAAWTYWKKVKIRARPELQMKATAINIRNLRQSKIFRPTC